MQFLAFEPLNHNSQVLRDAVAAGIECEARAGKMTAKRVALRGRLRLALLARRMPVGARDAELRPGKQDQPRDIGP